MTRSFTSSSIIYPKGVFAMFANVNWRKEYDIFCTGPMFFLELFTLALVVLAPRLPAPSTQGMMVIAFTAFLFSIWITGLERVIRCWIINYRYGEFSYADAALTVGYIIGAASFAVMLRSGMPALDAAGASVGVELLTTGPFTILFAAYARIYAEAESIASLPEPATE